VKKLLWTIWALGFVLFMYALVFAVTTYFLEDRFNITDATPVADPYTSTGGQSIDVIQTDGTLAIATGKITFTKQTTPVDGELGIRYDSTKATYIGAAAFFKVVFKEINNGIAASDNASTAFGFTTTDAATASGFAISPAAQLTQAISTTGSQFLIFPIEITVQAWVAPTTPTLNDTFYLAVINGGSDEGASPLITSVPWYSGGGLSLADYSDGTFYFIKKGTGPWILQGINPNFSAGANAKNPYITSYNSTFEVYDLLVLANGDSAYNPYMQPLHYQSCAPTSGQLFDDTPEVGAAWDSVRGNFTFTSNSVIGDGTNDCISTTELSDPDVYTQLNSSINNTAAGRVVGIVLRRNPSTGEHLLIQLNTTTDNITINSHNGTSYTQRAAASVSISNDANFSKLLGSSVIDSSVAGYFCAGSASTQTVSTSYTSAANTFFSQNNTDHGIRFGTDGTTAAKFIRFYAMGNDDEYANLSNFFSQDDNGTKRIRQIYSQ
jgi:hypothetical protein